jgi:hypothetical protein
MELHLMISFLNHTSQELSMNLLTFRKPTNIYCSDASELGIEGYNIATGTAWSFVLLVDCHLIISLNSLEFLSWMINLLGAQVIIANESYFLSIMPHRQLYCKWVAEKVQLCGKNRWSSAVNFSPLTSLLNNTNRELLVQSMVSGGGERSVQVSLMRFPHSLRYFISTTFFFLPWTCTVWFKNTTSPYRHCFLADLSAAQLATKGAVVEGANAKQVCTWTWYTQYLFSIWLQHDLYLDNFLRGHKHKILSAFVESRFCSRASKHIKAVSVSATLDCVAQAYKLADRVIQDLTPTGNLCSFYKDNYVDTPLPINQNPQK